MSGDTKLQGPDLKTGIAADDLAEGAMLLGHADGEPVLLARRGREIFAIRATCTHYGGPLAEGLMVGETVRCPWHHACFSLRSGEALAAPALDAEACWRVEERDGRIHVHEKTAEIGRRMPAKPHPTIAAPARMVILGGGAAGYAAAEMLRREAFGGSITVISADEAAPYDRPNLSKDYLAGNAPEEWLPLRPPAFYADNAIDLLLGAEAAAIDTAARIVTLADGRSCPFDKLLIATGAEPTRLDVPGAELPHVRLLRSLADCRAIIAQAQAARRAVVIGGSFIGLEVAASLRQRGLDVHVVARDELPMKRTFGAEIGRFIQSLHQSRGVVFHLRHTIAGIAPGRVTLDDGTTLDADLVVVGIGVRPRLDLADRAGLALDRGILVDERLETSVPGIFAAGDVARWPDRFSGERLRIEHWVVAERQGQTAARNMLGHGEYFTSPPFFWTRHYDTSIQYVGHAAQWDTIDIGGDIDGHDAALRYRRAGRTLALATISRGRESLQGEVKMERAEPL